MNTPPPPPPTLPMHHAWGARGLELGRRVRAVLLSGGWSHRHWKDGCISAEGQGTGAMPHAAGGGDASARMGGESDGSDAGTQPRGQVKEREAVARAQTPVSDFLPHFLGSHRRWH